MTIALVLLADEKPDIPMDMGEWGLEKYDSVIVASRECRPVAFLDRVKQIHPNVQYRALDSETVFQHAKCSYLTAVADFRKWFCSRLMGPKATWWLTSVSLPDNTDPVFILFLCQEFQRSVEETYPCCTISTHVVTQEAYAHFFPWPLPTVVVSPNSKLRAMIALLMRDLYTLGVNICSRLVHALANRRAVFWARPVDLCFLAWGDWGEHDGHSRNRYYTELPEHFRDAGLSVAVVAPSDALRHVRSAPPKLDAIIEYRFRSILLAVYHTVRFAVGSLLNAIRLCFTTKMRQKVWMKPFLLRLMVCNRSLFTKILMLHGFQDFFQRHRTGAIITYTELYLNSRALLLGLSRLSPEHRPISIGFQHGLISENKISYMPDRGDADIPFPACDFYFAYNRLAGQIYDRLFNGRSRQRVRIVGMHRVGSGGPQRLARTEKSISLDNLDSEQPVFLLVGSTPGRMEDAWAVICRLSRFARMQLIIKPHPEYPLSGEWLERFDTKHGSHLWYNMNYDLDWAISVSDYVLVQASTAVLNAVEQRRRIVLLALDGRFDPYQLPAWLDREPQAHVARSPEQLDRILVELLKAKPGSEAVYVKMDEYLPPFLGTDSMDAMCREVKQILDERRDNV
jgi:hypothetical protein